MIRSLRLDGFTRPPWPWLLGIAAAGQLLVLASTGRGVPSFFCGSAGWLVATDPGAAVALVLLIVGPAALAGGWLFMLVVMMPPVLRWPVMHLWRSSLPARRPRALGLFLVGYGVPWLVAGLPMVIAAILLRLLLGEGLAPAIAILLAALLWNASPWQRVALNRGHRSMRIGVSGWKADRDAAAFGLSHGGWCVVSCWPWMLAPMLAGAWHAPIMAAATVAMVVERLASPGRPRWRLPRTCVLIGVLAEAPKRMQVNHG